MRLFIGIELPLELKIKMDEFLLPLKINPKTFKQWEQWADYHLTMLFIGETSKELVDSIKAKMKSIRFFPFDLATNQFIFFNRRIMYLDFFDSPELVNLKNAIDEVFPEYIRSYEKEYVAHVTVKRWQRHEYDELIKGLANRSFGHFKFSVFELSLFKSERDENNTKCHVL